MNCVAHRTLVDAIVVKLQTMSAVLYLIIIGCTVRAGILDQLSIDILDPNVAEYLTDKEVGYLRIVNNQFKTNIAPNYRQRLSLVYLVSK